MVNTTKLIDLKANFKQLVATAYKGFCELAPEHPSGTIHASLPLTQEELADLGRPWVFSAVHSCVDRLRNPNECLLWGLKFPGQANEDALRLQFRIQLIDDQGNPL
jgi:hypothetical protein